MEVWKIIVLSKWVICRFHVNLPGCMYCCHFFLGGGLKDFLFSPLFGEDFPFNSYFSDGLKLPTSFTQLLKKFFLCRTKGGKLFLQNKRG